MEQIQNIVILTRAGISAESRLETFRSEDGLWAQRRIEEESSSDNQISVQLTPLRFQVCLQSVRV